MTPRHVALLLVAGALAFAGCRSKSETEQAPVPQTVPAEEPLMPSPVLGPEHAKVTIIEVSDFQ